MAKPSSSLFVLGLLFVSVALLNSLSCQAVQLFIFGDSNNDPGNKKYLTSTVVAANTWPYGVSVDAPSGKWSDGRIVADFIAEFLELPEIPGFLKPDADFTYGANFAVADATVTGTPTETLTFADQVAAFVGNKSLWTDAQRQAAIYMIYIGANDYLNSLDLLSKSSNKQQQEDLITEVIAGIKEQLTNLYNAGGRRFVIQNLAPLGCLPIVKQLYKHGNSCYELATSLAEQHNTYLLQTIKDLNGNLSGFQYSYYDYFGSITRRLVNTGDYRYFTADLSCCGVGTHFAYGCGKGNVHSTLCNYQRGYLWFDGRHNAEKTNEAIGHVMYSSDPSVIWPMNVRELSVFPTTSSTTYIASLRKMMKKYLMPTLTWMEYKGSQ